MGKIMEAIFCVGYLIAVAVLGTQTLARSKGNRESTLFGVLSLVLVGGDAFHLVPRIFAAVNPAGNYTAALGIGKLVTSVTMTIFYLLLYFYYEQRYHCPSSGLRLAVIGLSVVRIALCLFPQNDWTGAAPVIWGVYRNIPFTVLGALMVVLWYRQRKDAAFRWMWLAITLSFAFYLPVVLWADVSPMVGMLMMPKTCMYIWAVVMGWKLTRPAKEKK